MSYYLPWGVWETIFHKLPLRSLVKCISVCKAWKSLITDKIFIHSHLSYTTTQANNDNDYLFLLFYEIKQMGPAALDFDDFYSLYSETGHFPIFKSPINFPVQHVRSFNEVGTCNGLICFATYSTSGDINVVIMNPSIQKYIVLPKPTITSSPNYGFYVWCYNKFGFGFDSRNIDFKVVRIVIGHHMQVEIYSFATGKWRNITNRTPSLCYYPCGLSHPHHQVFVNGAVHWIVHRSYQGSRHDFILKFDLVEETFGELMLPQSWDKLSSSSQQSLLGGSNSLALAIKKYLDSINNDAVFDIWVMKENGVANSWNLVFSFNSRDYGGISRVMALRSSGEVVLKRDGGEIIILDPKKDLVKSLGHEKYVVHFVRHHVESLFLIDMKK